MECCTAEWQFGMVPQVPSDCDVSVNQLCTKQLRVNLVRLENDSGWTADLQLGLMPQVPSDCDVSVNQLCPKQLRVNLVRLDNDSGKIML
ncbi:unnamed protein product [Leptidea sinapis]|uniref:Uncharacterized protein n=1 Tax=Leptidea sinapis TaxID=189913 RepID=A0A5E4QNE8_9NEOP|nr:unnamed protein product [Leptidea sinapis]